MATRPKKPAAAPAPQRPQRQRSVLAGLRLVSPQRPVPYVPPTSRKAVKH